MNNSLPINSSRHRNRFRFNPLTHLTPRRLSRLLDDFDAGHLSEAAIIFDLLEQRDDLLRGVISKRKKSVARHGWTVVPVAGADPEAARQQMAALEFFYNHLECEHAIDTAERGGFKLLARQMMDAVGKRFAVHEIVWKAADGASGTHPGFVTAKFRFVPLSYFENTTGELRFLENESSLAGVPLQPGAWMVTVGEGLMAASATAWMFKNLSLNDWLNSCEHKGSPGLIGVSASGEGTPERQALESALRDLLEGAPVVHGTADSIRVLDLLAGGDLPYPELVERIDRLLASLWRGADLSTLSRDRGYGASLQEKETCALEEDDADMLTETLNRYVDEWVIRHVFGPEARPLARVKVLVSPRECTTNDLHVDEFLLRHGAPLSVEETLNRYGRTLPKAGEKVFLRGSLRDASLSASSQNWLAHIGNEHTDALCAGAVRGGPDVSSRRCSQFPHNDPGESGEAPSLPGRELPNDRFTLLQPDWVQLTPYGDFPHARGLQRMDRPAAEAMVAQFNSFRGRVGRLFGGVPFYVGHPDLPGSSELADRKAYGWVTELEARDDGLYGRVSWSEAGLELLRNAHYKFFSPFWEAREIGTENGRKIYRPTALISVGLTNQPNIPVKPLANEDRDGNAPAAAADLSLEAGNTSTADGVRSSDPATTHPSHSHNGQINTSMHTVSLTNSLGARRGERSLQNRRDRIQECVLRKMNLGMTYDEAWEAVKREHAALFREMVHA